MVTLEELSAILKELDENAITAEDEYSSGDDEDDMEVICTSPSSSTQATATEYSALAFKDLCVIAENNREVLLRSLTKLMQLLDYHDPINSLGRMMALVDAPNVMLLMWKQLSCYRTYERSEIIAIACMQGRLNFIKLLLDADANIFRLKKPEALEGMKRSCIAGRLECFSFLVAKYGIVAEDPLMVSNYDMLFSHACLSGNLQLASWMVETFKRLRPTNHTIVGTWYRCCAQGRLEMTKWIVSTFGLTEASVLKNSTYAFKEACAGGYMDVVVWLKDFCHITHRVVKASDIFYQTLIRGCLPVLVWLKETFELKQVDAIDALQRRPSILSYPEYATVTDVVEWIVETFSIPPNIVLQLSAEPPLRLLSEALYQNNLRLAKWITAATTQDAMQHLLMSDPRARRFILETTCRYGYHEAFVWCLETFAFNRSEVTNEGGSDFQLFVLACQYGKLTTAKYIHSKYALNPATEMKCIARALTLAACASYGETVKWLATEFLVPIEAIRDEVDRACGALAGACRNGAINMVKWLVEYYKFEKRDIMLVFTSVCMSHSETLVEWLVTHFGITTDDMRREKNAALGCALHHLTFTAWFYRYGHFTQDDAKEALRMFQDLSRDCWPEGAIWLSINATQQQQQPVMQMVIPVKHCTINSE
jgi:hypothetical protein